MPTDPNAALYEDEDDELIEALVARIRAESDELAAILPRAVGAQWRPAQIPRPREDTAERASGGHSNPTLDTVADGRRLRLRVQVLRSERVLRDAAVALRGVRRGLEIALSRWEGDEGTEHKASAQGSGSRAAHHEQGGGQAERLPDPATSTGDART